MRFSCLAAFACAFLLIVLAACGGSRGGCGAQSIPVGPVPAGTPIPVQPLPANSGISTNVWVTVDFAVDASGTVTGTKVQVSSGSAAVDAAAIQIVKTTTFKVIDTNCEGQAVRAGFVMIEFSPNATPAPSR
jgi:TonB family protein